VWGPPRPGPDEWLLMGLSLPTIGTVQHPPLRAEPMIRLDQSWG
jgi:hypothetical protein